MNETILVTGATGFIGSRIVAKAVENGHTVRVFKRESSDTSRLSSFDVDFYTGDVLDKESIEAAVEGCDAVIHTAGISLKNADEETVTQVNVEGTRNVLEASLDSGVKRLVYTSSAGALGTEGIVTEADPRDLDGAYQKSKASAENIVSDFNEKGLDCVIVNPTTVFGSGDTKFTERILRLATDKKLFVYFPGGANVVWVDDVAQGHIDALQHGTPGERYLLGGDNLTYGEMLDTVARRSNGSKPPIRIPRSVIHSLGPVAGFVNSVFGISVFPFSSKMAKMATKKRFYSTEKAKNELNYSPTPFEEHVDKTIEWYLEEY